MLVLSRGVEQKIVFEVPPSTEPQRIEVMVLDFRRQGDPRGGARVRLGIDAPKDITVHRKEIQDQIDGDKPPQ